MENFVDAKAIESEIANLDNWVFDDAPKGSNNDDFQKGCRFGVATALRDMAKPDNHGLSVSLHEDGEMTAEFMIYDIMFQADLSGLLKLAADCWAGDAEKITAYLRKVADEIEANAEAVKS